MAIAPAATTTELLSWDLSVYEGLLARRNSTTRVVSITPKELRDIYPRPAGSMKRLTESGLVEVLKQSTSDDAYSIYRVLDVPIAPTAPAAAAAPVAAPSAKARGGQKGRINLNIRNTSRPLTRPTWLQWDGEPDAWYARFCAYRDLGPDRTITAARLQLGVVRGGQGMWRAAADGYRWEERVAAFDAATPLDRAASMTARTPFQQATALPAMASPEELTARQTAEDTLAALVAQQTQAITALTEQITELRGQIATLTPPKKRTWWGG
jgi:hypothetical protein